MNREYYLCNLKEKIALQYMQLPNVFENISGMQDLPYDEVKNLSWANQPDYGFLTKEDCDNLNISLESLDLAKQGLNNTKWNEIRALRNKILIATDIAVLCDRWETYTDFDKKNIRDYRQALRDITKQDIDDIKWPDTPLCLDYIRVI